jgi:hypothetical protein
MKKSSKKPSPKPAVKSTQAVKPVKKAAGRKK